MTLPGWEMNEGQKPNFHGFIVIGAGLPRTGTNSLRTALNIILDGAVYHMFQLMFGEKVDVTFWDRAMKRKLSKREWKDFLEGRGFRGGVDYPISLYYKDLMEVFPDAKVILTVREPETWYKSVKSSIFQMRNLYKTFPYNILLWINGRWNHMRLVNDLSEYPGRGYTRGMFQVIEEGEEASIKFYNDWVEEVKRTVPEDRLLIFSVKEGWEPLCKFLEFPIPEQPFPRTNDSNFIQNLVQSGKLQAYLTFLGLPTLLGIIVYFYKETISKWLGSFF